MGARVINVSITGQQLTLIEQEAVNEAVKQGALVIVAAGNEATDVKGISPAGLKGVITVAATNHKDERENYSNWGGSVDIAAPGADILSLRAIQTDLMQFEDKNYKPGSHVIGTYRHYYRLSGTSFATSYVSGVASLLFSVNPGLTAEQVKRMILMSADDIEVPGWDLITGYGLLDARAALMADPEYYLLALIKKVQAVQEKDKVYLEVLGTADSSNFKKARIDLGKGEEPKKWKKVAVVKKPVSQGRLGLIPATEFKKSGKWTLRLQARDKKGKVRESRASVDID